MSSDAVEGSPATPEIIAEDSIRTISIEYCTGCSWIARASWMAQEILTTFQDELDEVRLVPVRVGSGNNPHGGNLFNFSDTVTLNGGVLWDRESKGYFPEMKELKRRIRDVLSPDRYNDMDQG
eukprot:6062567-Ditylum_brightwellii.AAC.1